MAVAQLPEEITKAVKVIDDLTRSRTTDVINLHSLQEEVQDCQAETKRVRQKIDRAETDRRNLQKALPKVRESLDNDCSLRKCVTELRNMLDATTREMEAVEAKHRDRETRMQEEHSRKIEAFREMSQAREREAETRRTEERLLEEEARKEELQRTRDTYTKILEDFKARLSEMERDRDRMQKMLEARQQQRQQECCPLSPRPAASSLLQKAPPNPWQQENWRNATASLSSSETRFSFESTPVTGESDGKKRVKVTLGDGSDSSSSGGGTTSALFGLPAGARAAEAQTIDVLHKGSAATLHPAVQRTALSPGKNLMNVNRMYSGQKRKLFNPDGRPNDEDF